MGKITMNKTREIIEDFEKAINEKKETGARPSKTVIEFRNDRKVGKERLIYLVPINLLRYSKENGRIASDVLNYEKFERCLDETTNEGQGILHDFLASKDKEKTDELKKSIKHDGQRDPAIITCDGFLVNGNRRKMVLQDLNDRNCSTMKVVILPGKGDEGGPPTLLEIEQIENRCQLQSDAKAEYSSFDRALSMRRKIEYGMSLEEQLRDDPIYAGLNGKDFNKAVKRMKEQYLKPLERSSPYIFGLKNAC